MTARKFAVIVVALVAGTVFVVQSLNATTAAELYFEENRGQWPDEIRYATQGERGAVGVVSDGAIFTRSDGGDPLRLRLLESEAHPVVEGQTPLSFRIHRFIGNDPHRWISRIPAFGRVVSRSVYPGIDLVFHGETALEYDFIVHPDADPGAIRFRFDGAEPPRVAANGDLLLGEDATTLRMKRPFAYQTLDGTRVPVATDFHLDEEEVSFRIGPYDPSRMLVIDPVVLGYSTFLGGSGVDAGFAIAVDTDRNVYLSGSTTSADFPVAPGGVSPPISGPNDSFIAKLSPSGSELLFVTFLGGNGDEGSLFRGLEVDSSGAVYLASNTSSTDFPVTEEALQSEYAGGNKDGFLTKLSPDGATILASTYLGGRGLDRIQDMGLDPLRNVYVGGFTESPDFPTTEAAFQRDRRGDADAVVMKLRMEPFEVVYSTLIGGSGREEGRKIEVDRTGAVYIGGNTRSEDYPVTAGVVQERFAGLGTVSSLRGDVFLTKLDPTGSGLIWSTYLGGSQGENLDSLFVDRQGAAFLSGLTCGGDFPVSASAAQPDLRGQCDGFVAGVSEDGTTLRFGTFIGGTATDEAWSVSVDPRGNIHVGGSTSSSDFPATGDAFQATMGGGGHDGMFAILTPDGSQFLQASFLGGTAPPENVFAISTDLAGNLYLTGSTESMDFPIAVDAFQPTYAGVGDVFLTKIVPDSPSIEGERSILPVVGSAAGALGSFFKTSVQLHNPENEVISGRFVFHPQGQPASENDPELIYFLDPHETIAFTDLPRSMETNGIGSLDLVAPDGESPVSLVRVFNDAGASGTTGLFEEQIVPMEAAGEGMTRVLLAPLSLERSRFNIGLRTLEDGVTFTATIRRSDGFEAGQVTRSYPEEFFIQQSASDLLGIAIMASDSISFRIEEGNAVIYGATTDNTTQDPSLQIAKGVDSVQGERRFLPAVASTPGQFGSFFKTSLQLHNATLESIRGELVYHAPGAPNSATLGYDLEPGVTTALEDLLPELGTSGIGSLDIVSSAGPLPLSVARVYNDAGEEGTTGITEEQVAVDQVLRAGDRGILIGSIDPERARFNIGVRTLEEGAVITAIVRNSAGVAVREVVLEYPASHFVQLPAANLLGVAFLGNDVVELTVHEGSAIIYGATTDNVTQDPTMMIARRR